MGLIAWCARPVTVTVRPLPRQDRARYLENIEKRRHDHDQIGDLGGGGLAEDSNYNSNVECDPPVTTHLALPPAAQLSPARLLDLQ